MASPGNQHCANCIGTLLFPIGLVEENLQADRVAAIGIRGSSTYRFTCLKYFSRCRETDFLHGIDPNRVRFRNY